MKRKVVSDDVWSPISFQRVMTCSHNLFPHILVSMYSFPWWSHPLTWFQWLSLCIVDNLQIRNSSSEISSSLQYLHFQMPNQHFLHRHLSDFKFNLSNPTKSLFPCPFQINKQTRAKLFLKVSVTVMGNIPLQGIQIDSSFGNQGWCWGQTLI